LNTASGDPGRRRLYQLAGTVAAAAVIVAVLVVISDSSPTAPKLKQLTAAARTSTQALIASWAAGTAQHTSRDGAVLWGDLNAPVTDREYIDLQCSACDQHFVGLSRTGGDEIQLIALIRSGKLKVEFFPLPTVTRTVSMLEAEWSGLLAAAQQAKGVQYLFTNYVLRPPEGSFTVANILDTGRATPGLNYPRWNIQRTNPALAAQTITAVKRAARLGLASTPTTVFTSAKGTAGPFAGVYPASTYQEAVKRLGG
jgi:protein-disulfide isomerase